VAIDPSAVTTALCTVGGVILGALGTMTAYIFKTGRYVGQKDTESDVIRKLDQKVDAMHERLDMFHKTNLEFAGKIGALEGEIRRIKNGGHH
jgi:ATP-dependent 26S proteasome regulatory subunit